LKPATCAVVGGVFVRVSDSGLQASSISDEESLMPARRELTMRRQMRLNDGASAREIGRPWEEYREVHPDTYGYFAFL
jgi:hypothetical protein